MSLDVVPIFPRTLSPWRAEGFNTTGEESEITMRFTKQMQQAMENCGRVNVAWTVLTGEPGFCTIAWTGDKKTDAKALKCGLEQVKMWGDDLEEMARTLDKKEWSKAANKYERDNMRDPEYYAAKEAARAERAKERAKQEKAKKQQKPKKAQKPAKTPARKPTTKKPAKKASTLVARRAKK